MCGLKAFDLSVIISRMDKSSENYDKLRLDFISTVSHELRTPLTSIRGFAETLIVSHDKLTTEQQLKFLGIIKDQSNRLINLVENLLSASAQVSSDEIYIYKPTSVIHSVDKMITVLRQKYPRKEFDIKIPAKVPDILVDSEKFEQILLNVMENACKYSFENSSVGVFVKSFGEKYLTIYVANDGVTISCNDKEKIFEKFVRLDNPMTSRTQGSGMGLYLARNMAKKMNGNIDFTSSDEHTEFLITMPIATDDDVAKIKLKEVKND